MAIVKVYAERNFESIDYHPLLLDALEEDGHLPILVRHLFECVLTGMVERVCLVPNCGEKTWLVDTRDHFDVMHPGLGWSLWTTPVFNRDEV